MNIITRFSKVDLLCQLNLPTFNNSLLRIYRHCSYLYVYQLQAQRRTSRKSVAYVWNSSYDACILIKHVKICYYIFLSMILVEKAQYNSCCVLFIKRRKIAMQWSHVKTFVFVCYCFYCLTSIFFVLFCFGKTNFDVFNISELSGLRRNVLFMEIYTPMKSSILSLTKYAIFM